MTEGIIIKALSGFYYVQCGDTLVSCKARGKFRLDGTSPLAGDRVLCYREKDGSGRIIGRNEALFCLPKHFPFEKPEITLRCEGNTVTLAADAFCMGVEVQAGDARFSDNWLTLYPGEPRKITADRPLRAEEIRLLWIE